MWALSAAILAGRRLDSDESLRAGRLLRGPPARPEQVLAVGPADGELRWDVVVNNLIYFSLGLHIIAFLSSHLPYQVRRVRILAA